MDHKRLNTTGKRTSNVDLREFEPQSEISGHGAAAAAFAKSTSSPMVASTVPSAVVLQDTVQPHDFEVGYTKKEQDRIRLFQRAAFSKNQKTKTGNDSAATSNIVKVGLTAGETSLLAATDALCKKKKISFSTRQSKREGSPPEVHLSLAGGGGHDNDEDASTGDDAGVHNQDGDSSSTATTSSSDGDEDDMMQSSNPRHASSIFHAGADVSLFERLNGPHILTSSVGGVSASNIAAAGPTLTTSEVDDVIEHVLFSTDLLKQNLFTLLELHTTEMEERRAVEDFAKRWQGVLEFDATKDALKQLDQIQAQLDRQSSHNNKSTRKQLSRSSFSKQLSQSAKNSPNNNNNTTSPEIDTVELAGKQKDRFEFLSKMRSIVHSAFLYAFQEICLRHQERHQHSVSHRSLFSVVERSMDVENEAMKLAQSNKLLQSKLDASQREVINIKASKEQSLREFLTELQQVRQKMEEMQRIHGDTESVPKLLSGVDRGGGPSSPSGGGLGNTYSSMNAMLGGSFGGGNVPMGGGSGGGDGLSELSPEDRHLKFLNRKLTVECAVLNHSLSQRANTIRALENELETTNASFSKSRLELAKALAEQEHVDNTLAEAVDMASTLSDLRIRCSDLEAECAQRKDNILDLTKRLTQASDEYAALDSTHQYTLKVHEAEVQKLHNTIKEGTMHVEAEFNAKLLEVYERHEDYVNILKEASENLQRSLDAKEEERFKLQTEIGDYHLQLDEAQNEVIGATMQVATVKAQMASQQSNFEMDLADKDTIIVDLEYRLQEAEVRANEAAETARNEPSSNPQQQLPQRPTSADTRRLPHTLSSTSLTAGRRPSIGLQDHQKDKEAYAEARVASVANQLHEEALQHQTTINNFNTAKRTWEAQRESLVVDVDHKDKVLTALQRYIGVLEGKLNHRPTTSSSSSAALGAPAEMVDTTSTATIAGGGDVQGTIDISEMNSEDVIAAQQELRKLTSSLNESSRNLKARIQEQADQDISSLRKASIAAKRNSVASLFGGDTSPHHAATNAVQSRRRSSAISNSGFIAFPSPDLLPHVLEGGADIAQTPTASTSQRESCETTHGGTPLDSIGGNTMGSQYRMSRPISAAMSRPTSGGAPRSIASSSYQGSRTPTSTFNHHEHYNTLERRQSLEKLKEKISPYINTTTSPPFAASGAPTSSFSVASKDRLYKQHTQQPSASPPSHVSSTAKPFHHEGDSPSSTSHTKKKVAAAVITSSIDVPEDVRVALKEALEHIEKRNAEIDELEAILDDQQHAMEELLDKIPNPNIDDDTTKNVDGLVDGDAIPSPIAGGMRRGSLVTSRPTSSRPVIHKHLHTNTTTHVTNTTSQHATIVLLDDAQAGAYQAAARSMRAIRDLHLQRQQHGGESSGRSHHSDGSTHASIPPSSLETVFPGLEAAAEHFELFQHAAQLQTQLQQLIDVSRMHLETTTSNNTVHSGPAKLGVFRSIQATVLGLQNRLAKKKEIITAKRQDELESVLGSTQAISRGVTPFSDEANRPLGVRTFGSSTPIPRQHKLGPAPYTPSAVVSGIGATVISGGPPARANPLVNRAPLQTSQLELLQGKQIPRPQSIATSTSMTSTSRPQSATPHKHHSYTQNTSVITDGPSAILSSAGGGGVGGGEDSFLGGVLHGRSFIATPTYGGDASALLDTTNCGSLPSPNNTSPNRNLIARPVVTSTRVARPSTASDSRSGGVGGGGSKLSAIPKKGNTLGTNKIPRPSSSTGAYRGGNTSI